MVPSCPEALTTSRSRCPPCARPSSFGAGPCGPLNHGLLRQLQGSCLGGCYTAIENSLLQPHRMSTSKAAPRLAYAYMAASWGGYILVLTLALMFSRGDQRVFKLCYVRVCVCVCVCLCVCAQMRGKVCCGSSQEHGWPARWLLDVAGLGRSALCRASPRWSQAGRDGISPLLMPP